MKGFHTPHQLTELTTHSWAQGHKWPGPSVLHLSALLFSVLACGFRFALPCADSNRRREILSLNSSAKSHYRISLPVVLTVPEPVTVASEMCCSDCTGLGPRRPQWPSLGELLPEEKSSPPPRGEINTEQARQPAAPHANSGGSWRRLLARVNVRSSSRFWQGEARTGGRGTPGATSLPSSRRTCSPTPGTRAEAFSGLYVCAVWEASSWTRRSQTPTLQGWLSSHL